MTLHHDEQPVSEDLVEDNESDFDEEEAESPRAVWITVGMFVALVVVAGNCLWFTLGN